MFFTYSSHFFIHMHSKLRRNVQLITASDQTQSNDKIKNSKYIYLKNEKKKREQVQTH